MLFLGSDIGQLDPQYRAVTRSNIDRLPQWSSMPVEIQEAVKVVSTVLPFRTNQYVMDELIDWEDIPNDPIFQLTFVQREMLAPADYERMAALTHGGASRHELHEAAVNIRQGLNPHPGGQMTHNVPTLDGVKLEGVQHKYKETVLFFPSQGQTCHAYCTFCFRWAQFIGDAAVKFQATNTDCLRQYLRVHPDVSDLLVTGGDPMIMRTRKIIEYLEPILTPELEHVQNIRIGTKSVAYWPQRFVTDRDAKELLEFFERIVATGRHLTIMGHYNHPRELSTSIAREAVRRIRATGAQIRMQSPLVAHVNDAPEAWSELWRVGVQLGCVPYYMFVERNTGQKHYFEVPLARAWSIFQEAYQGVSGLGRTVRGPVMSAFPGKVLVNGTAEIHGEKVFCLQLLQARNPELVGRPFFAKFDETATWLTDLTPAFGESQFPFGEFQINHVAPKLTSMPENAIHLR